MKEDTQRLPSAVSLRSTRVPLLTTWSTGRAVSVDWTDSTLTGRSPSKTTCERISRSPAIPAETTSV